jgi:hypothetical protein
VKEISLGQLVIERLKQEVDFADPEHYVCGYLAHWIAQIAGYDEDVAAGIQRLLEKPA